MNKLIPNMYSESIYKIDYKKLIDKNIKCLLFDLDNTCVPYPTKTPSEEMINLFKKLKAMNFRVIIFSNTTPNRLEKFKQLDVEISALSKKPQIKNFNRIMNKYNYKKEEVCIIGDQLFTDIYGGNSAKIKTLLVDPLGNKDFIFTKLTRIIEKIIYKKFAKKKILKKGEYFYE